MKIKYSDYLIDSLVELGYTHCFFVGGGNVMHLLEAARTRMTCIAVVNEASAGIAAEYFNVANRSQNERAFALVTAGPGLTNIVTAIGSAWMESRELLVIGGQARTEFLSRGTVRQMGHQEIDGVSIVESITKAAKRVESPMSFSEIKEFVKSSSEGRKGPVFLEVCLDVSSTFDSPSEEIVMPLTDAVPEGSLQDFEKNRDRIIEMWSKSQRPLLLVGLGVNFETFQISSETLESLGLPVATSWNAIDYLDYESKIYAGRPDTYGMRWANAVVQQADLVISIGTRLGLQQTGFNWEEFVPVGQIIQIDIDKTELNKENPGTDLRINADSNLVFPQLIELLSSTSRKDTFEWIEFIAYLKETLPASEEANNIFPEHVNPFNIIDELSDIASADWRIVPCSSGGSYTSMMQSFRQKRGQILPSNKGLASMGYGLAGAIGVSIANPSATTVLVEGDGGFAQNLSELGTVSNRKLNLKIFLTSNGGYASIRISQKAYFDGNYIGCDVDSGLGLPDWDTLFNSYGIPVYRITESLMKTPGAIDALHSHGPAAFVLQVHVDQPFLPKLTSRIYPDGSMKSNPIHLMHPPLEENLVNQVFKYLPESLRRS